MSEPTPGPWKVSDNPNSNYGCEVVANTSVKAKRVVCRVGGPDREANAALIAAAPAMSARIEALEKALKQIQQALAKDSLTDSERVSGAKQLSARALIEGGGA